MRSVVGECRKPVESFSLKDGGSLLHFLCYLCSGFSIFFVTVVAINRRPAHYVTFNFISKSLTFLTTILPLSKEHVTWDGFSSRQLLIPHLHFLTLLFFLPEYLFGWYTLSIAHLTQTLLGRTLLVTIRLERIIWFCAEGELLIICCLGFLRGNLEGIIYFLKFARGICGRFTECASYCRLSSGGSWLERIKEIVIIKVNV